MRNLRFGFVLFAIGISVVSALLAARQVDSTPPLPVILSDFERVEDSLAHGESPFGLAFVKSGAHIATYRARFNISALEDMNGRRDLGWSEGRGLGFVAGQNVRLPLPKAGNEPILSIRSERRDVDGVTSYSGWINGSQANLATIGFNGEFVTARLHLGRLLYVLTGDVSADRLDLHVIDKTKAPDKHMADHEDSEQSVFSFGLQSHPQCTSVSNNDNGNVRILFYYTPEVDWLEPDIDLLISQIIGEFNSSTVDSGVDPKNHISLAGSLKTDIDFNWGAGCQGPNGCCTPFEILELMATQSGEFSDIQSEMDAHYADGAMVIVSEDCNRIGGGLHPAHDMNDPHPFMLTTSVSALGDLTAIHEIGHMLGGAHQEEHESQSDLIPNAPDCARGFMEPDRDDEPAAWQTMMSGYGVDDDCKYDWQKSPDNQDCIRLPMWSNPNITYGTNPAKPTGSYGVQGVADAYMAMALDMTMTDVALWGKTYPDPAPGTPQNLSVQSAFCHGLNQVTWDSEDYTEHYQLLASADGGQSWFVAYHGDDESTLVDVPQSENIWDLRVRACNGSGCSNLSSSVMASYYSGCL